MRFLLKKKNEVVQNPEKIGNGLKTISMRIRGAKTELEEAGESTDGMATSTASLRAEIMALSGVDIMLDANTFKSTYQIMEELSVKWKDLNDISQATIIELMAGKHQGNTMSSLMENFDIAQKALQTSLKSTGSAMNEHEKWQKSLEARLNSLKASWQSLSQSFLQSDFLKGVIDFVTKLVDAIDFLIDRFGVLNLTLGMFMLGNAFKTGFAKDGSYTGIFSGLGKTLKTDIVLMKSAATQTGALSLKMQRLGNITKQTGQHIRNSFTASSKQIKTMVNDIAKIVVIMNAIRAVQDIFSWISDAGKDAETTAEKFDRISDELSGVESELNGLESELSSVENQIDALLEKDELSFADEEELARLREISSELEHQIKLTETLQKSLNKSLSETSMDVYEEYLSGTSFYSDKSKQERKEESSSLYSSIGNIVGLIGGAALAYFTGGISVLAGGAIGSVLGSTGGELLGGVISNASYDSETTVGEMLDRMILERKKLEQAEEKAKTLYDNDPTPENKKAYDEASDALSGYNTTLSEHVKQVSEYYNSIDYDTLDSLEDKQKYLDMGDVLDKYNIEMGTKGAKSTALDRIFSEELITEKAKGLRAAIEATLNSGEKINFTDFDSEQFTDIKNRLLDMGITIVDVVSYFEDLEKAEEEASNNFETYEMVSSIAAFSDGVSALTEAFAEFNEQGNVTATTLVELHEIFGSLGEDWTNYVDVMTNGISSIEDARKATEQLVESYTDDLFKSGGIKFAKLNTELSTDENKVYDFDEDGYKTYLSTVNQLENLGIENAKEYTDALQQQAMVREAAAQKAKDFAEKEALLAKETLTEKEQTRLSVLEAKKIDDYIFEIESSYGIRLKDSGLVQKQYELDGYNSIIKDREEQIDKITNYLDEYRGLTEQAETAYGDYEEAKAKGEAIENRIIQDSIEHAKYASDSPTGVLKWNDFEAIDDLFGTNWFDTDWDSAKRQFDDADSYYDIYEQHLKSQKDKFENLVNIAKESNIDLSDIIPDVDNFEFDATSDNDAEIFEQVYNRVESALNSSIDDYENLANEASAEIEARLNNLGLEIDFGRNFDKIVIDSAKGKIDQLNTALSEMFSGGGLSTDSIIAVDEIFGELNSYDSSKLFENTANGVRLNTEEYKRLSNEIKNVNIGALESELDDLGDQYIETRDELNKLTYGTMEYQEKARELDGIAAQISANEELISQYKSLFSSYQEWQRAEAAGSERNMYETVLEGWESVGDEISRGWVDEGTREFLELLKGEKATIIDGNGVAKEINIATASAKELKQVWKGLDKDIEHTTYSVRDFFTVDEDGNSTSQGVYNFLDAIGQMEEEKFGGKDVVRRDGDRIIGFDFQLVGGDKAIAEALGVSEELVQIMKRAAIDAGFAVNFDGSFEDIGVLKEKAESAAKEMNKILKAEGKATIDIDMNVDSVEEIQPQIDKIMETFGKRDGNGKLTGEIDMSIKGSDEALGVVRTLQSMLDEVTRPAYMDIQVGQVEEELRDPLYQLQQLRLLTEQKNQLKLGGADTSELENDIEECKNKVVDDLVEIQEKNPELAVDIEIDGLSREEIAEKVEKGEIKIPATVDLQIEMADSLDILAQTALFEQGLISEEEYKKRISVYLDTEVDDSGAKEEINKTIGELTGNETRDEVINIIANTYGVEDVEGLKNSMSGLTDEQVMAIAQAIGKGDVDALDSAVEGMDDKQVNAIANALGYDNVESLKSAVRNMQGNEVDAKVNTDGQSAKVATLQSDINNLKGTEVTIWAKIQKKASDLWNWVTGGGGETSEVNGTAHVNGTAYKRGNWRTKKTERALTGELGREIVVTPENKWYTVGDNGAEFVNIPRGSIVFNHKQTEELLKNGKATSNGGRAKALANGTAFLGGTAHIGVGEWVGVDSPSFKVGYDYKASSNKDSDKSQNIFDWIEVAIERIERKIDNLDRTANNVYKSWSSRNKALANEISEVGNEIALQEKAYEGYMRAANEIGLSSEWKKKVQNGAIDIDNVTDDTLKEKIQDYQNYYEKALDAKDAIEELKETESELYKQRVDNVSTRYEGILGVIEHEKNILEEYISQSEAQGWAVSKNYYNALIDNENDTIRKLKSQKNEMLAEFNAAMNSGTIAKNSEAYFEMINSIDEVTLAIMQSQTAIKEYQTTLQQLSWDNFDLLQEKISAVTEEADFLIELMNNDKLFDDKGQMTDEGKSTMGLHGQNYNTYMYQADLAGKEVTRLKKELAKDPYDQDLEKRYREMISLQQEYILSAEQEKDAIKDLVSEGIDAELEALQELIDKKNEALDSERELYEYQKQVKEQTEEIASLEKQIASFSGDDSEEAQAKVQQLKLDLESAQQDLEETEYERMISDTGSMLDTLYEQYSEILNMRLDNVDALVSEMIQKINDESFVIGNTIRETVDNVGYTLSDSMKTIWDSNTTNTNGVITTYGEGFTSAQTTTNNALSTINTNLQNIITQLNKKASTNVKSASTSSASKPQANTSKPTTNTTKPSTPSTPTKTIKVGGKINAEGAPIYDYVGDKSGERQLYRKDPIYNVLDERSGYLKTRWHKLSSGVTGWFKKSDVKAYAKGKKNFLEDEIAWTQEGRKSEMIVRPSDGAILTPIAKGDSVLTAAASNNIWQMANTPAEFIKNNLNLGNAGVPNNANVQQTYNQTIENVTFRMDNIKSYEETLHALKSDRRFEKLVNAMTIDRIAGGSSLAKNKSIR